MRDTPPDHWVDARLSLHDACAIVDRAARLRIAPEAYARCADAERRMQACIAENRHVYGLTTGFGPLANRLVPARDGIRLQQNLVHHLASGVGPMLGWRAARAVVLARLMSILQGVSGASRPAIDALVTVLGSDFAPQIPARGTVGASGDLTPLAHLVLTLQGRANFLRPDGTEVDGRTALAALGLAPLTLDQRDGLALVNGTSAMTGLALLNARAAFRCVDWSVALTGVLAEAMCARTEAWHPALSIARPHEAQRMVAEMLLSSVDGSRLVVSQLTAERILDASEEVRVEEDPGQDAYTLRCAPQVIGAVLGSCRWHAEVTVRELNAATDNPIFPDVPDLPAVHGGNFMGLQIALVSDALATGCTVLAGLVERQVARVTDERLNRGLPPFLHRMEAGLNSGFMGAQVTATALLAEMRAHAGSAAVQSISTNGANQDVVSMGTIAARMAADRLGDLRHIQAILALCAAQAVELRSEQRALEPTARTMEFLRFVRSHSPALVEDRPLGAEIELLAEAMEATPPPAMLIRSEDLADQAV